MGDKPTIKTIMNGPFLVKELKSFNNVPGAKSRWPRQQVYAVVAKVTTSRFATAPMSPLDSQMIR